MNERPNILFVMCDQMSALASSPYGNSIVKTPNIQALADRGTLFQSAYCNSPLCAPSRASMMTGKMPSSIPVNDNGQELPASEPTFVHFLRDQGYLTILSGKMHFVGPDQLHGFEERLTTDIYPADFGWTVYWPEQGMPPRKFGYDEDMVAPEPHMAEMITNAGPVASTYQHDYDEDTHFHALERLRSLSRRNGTDRKKPWFMCVSYTQPHDPFNPLQEYWDRYDDVDIQAPDTSKFVHHAADTWVNSWHGVDRTDITDEDVAKARRGYYAMISYIDDKLGQLLSELSKLGFDENTIVIFASDHGDMIGENGMFFKRTLREWSSRVPLIAAGPGISNAEVTSPVSLVDVFPTLLDLAGAGMPENANDLGLDGMSLWPLLAGGEHIDRPPVFLENYGEGTVRPIRGVVRGRYKYIYVHGETAQLFDLERDKNERRNLAGRPEFASIESGLRTLCFDGFDPDTVEADVIRSQRMRRIVQSCLMTGERTSWDFGPPRDPAILYIRNRDGSGRVDQPFGGGR